MTEVLPFKLEYFDAIEKSERTKNFLRYGNRQILKRLEDLPYNYSVLVDGKPLMCFGLLVFWENRAEAWALLDIHCKKHFLKLHQIAKKYLEGAPFSRVEAPIQSTFPQGLRWVRLLGFQVEAPLLKSYFPNGEDAVLFTKMKEVAVTNG